MLRFLIFTLFLIPLPLRAATFEDSSEKDYPLRNFGELQISNLRGAIRVEGWALEKVRVRLRKIVEAENEQEFKKILSSVGVSYRPIGKNLEIAADYGKGLEIHEKLQERNNQKVRMEMTVFAPQTLNFRGWSQGGGIELKNWRGKIDLRIMDGALTVENTASTSASLFCPACSVNVSNFRGNLRVVGGTEPVSLSTVSAGPIYVETNSGKVQLTKISGEQLYVTKSGAIDGRFFEGRVEFRSSSGDVKLDEIRGFLSGKSSSGNIEASVEKWSFADKAFLESLTGTISLALPVTFYGEVELASQNGNVRSDFPLEIAAETSESDPLHHLEGKAGSGGELLKVSSKSGNVLLRKYFSSSTSK